MDDLSGGIYMDECKVKIEVETENEETEEEICEACMIHYSNEVK